MQLFEYLQSIRPPLLAAGSFVVLVLMTAAHAYIAVFDAPGTRRLVVKHGAACVVVDAILAYIVAFRVIPGVPHDDHNLKAAVLWMYVALGTFIVNAGMGLYLRVIALRHVKGGRTREN